MNLREGEGEGWYAAVIEYRKKNGEIETREDFKLEKKTTYHKSALSALLRSLKRLNTECIVKIYTDCVYISNNYKNGNLKHWKTNGWKNYRGEDIKNKELWQQVSEELDKHIVTIERQRHNEYTRWMQEEAKKRFKKEASIW